MSRDRAPGHGPQGGEAWWDARGYAESATFQTDEGMRLIGQAGVPAGGTVLDLGCGDGRLTCELARRGARVVGLDVSAEMAAAAGARGLPVVRATGVRTPFPAGAFDAVFSNAAIHWVSDHRRLVTELARVLRPGGRLAARFGGVGNQWAITAAALQVLDEHPYREHGADRRRSPWTMGDPVLWATELERNGFSVRHLDLVAQPSGWRSAADMRRWFAAIAGPFTSQLPAPLRARFVDDAVSRAWDLVAPDRAFVRLVVDAVRIGAER